MKIYSYILSFFLFLGIVSCNESKWLKEEPKDFYTTENSYNTTAQFNEALNYMYDRLRDLYWNLDDNKTPLHFGDIAFGGTDYPDLKFNNFGTFFTPTTSATLSYWKTAYNIIANANIVINRIGHDNEVAEQDKAQIKGEALFFRAFFYRFLGHLYGGVPLVLEEVSTPRRDYVRATREEVYQQAVYDLEEAIILLSDIDQVKDGKVSKQAAQHLIAEVYISIGKYDKAIEAATAVIDYPKMALMTNRFGTKADDMEGNPYWDLFQLNNQNRSTSGNTETILALQHEYQNSGSNYGCNMPRYILPNYYNLNSATL